jgi:hypothetical protein
MRSVSDFKSGGRITDNKALNLFLMVELLDHQLPKSRRGFPVHRSQIVTGHIKARAPKIFTMTLPAG